MHQDAPARRWAAILVVYAAWLCALLVAGALGSARLLKSAERQPYGPLRDVLVAAAREVHAASGRLGLTEAALAVERLRGEAPSSAAVGLATESTRTPGATGPEAGTGDGTPASTAVIASMTSAAPSALHAPVTAMTATASTRSVPARPAGPPGSGSAGTATRAATPDGPRPVLPDAPLRVHVAGDSFAEPLGYQLATYATRDRLMSVGMDFRISSGLVRQDYFDWHARMVETIAAPTPPEVVVFFLGANEDQNMRVEDGTVHLVSSDAWRMAYERRAGALMDLFEGPGIQLVWIGMPPMRDARMAEAMVALTRAVEAAAKPRAWVSFVDTRPIFRGPEGGGFAAYLPSSAGDLVQMRGEDGIHLTRPGTNLVAERVYALLTRSWDLRTSTPTATASATQTATATPSATATASAMSTATVTRTATALAGATSAPLASATSQARATSGMPLASPSARRPEPQVP